MTHLQLLDYTSVSEWVSESEWVSSREKLCQEKNKRETEKKSERFAACVIYKAYKLLVFFCLSVLLVENRAKVLLVSFTNSPPPQKKEKEKEKEK